ncbi:glycosyltransferase family 2 protein [Paenibacillus sp. BAC0078]
MRSTIIIPNYNGLSYLDNCLRALLDEIDCELDEVVVVDNASTDQSIDFIKENYPFVKVILLEDNFGFSKAVNTGIKSSDSKYVVLLNNDTEVRENWLTNLLETIESDIDIFSVSSKMIRMNNKDIIDDAGDCLTVLGWAFKRGDGKSIECYNEREEIFSSCAGAAIYRRSIFGEIGMFDDAFFAYLEDVDVSYRAKVHGYKNYYCPKAEVYHIGSATSGNGQNGLNSFKVSLSARNNVYLIYKNMPLIQIVINSPFLLVGFIWKLYVYNRLGFRSEYFKGTVNGIFSLKKVKRVKHKIRFMKNYFTIQYQLIVNTFHYYFSRKA